MNHQAKKHLLSCYLDSESTQLIKDVATAEDRSISYIVGKEMVEPWIKKNRNRARPKKASITGQ